MSVPNLEPDQILVEGKVYSSTKLADLHPGGPLFLRAFSGRDATQAFLSYHRRTFPHSRVKEAFEHHHPDVTYDPATNADYLELCERIDKIIPRMKSFAPWSYFIKATFIWATAIGLEIHMHYNACYPWYETALLGFFYALMGLNIQHDANHGSLSRNPLVNRFWGKFKCTLTNFGLYVSSFKDDRDSDRAHGFRVVLFETRLSNLRWCQLERNICWYLAPFRTNWKWSYTMQSV